MEQTFIEQPHRSTKSELSVAVNNTTLSDSKAFITANTLECSLEDIRREHIIPVFLKDNEPVISHTDFIELAAEAVADVFQRETILRPSIRVSHPIMGRIPEAKHKPAKELHEWEKTLYYERMAFVIEVPTIQETVGGNNLSLTIGGVKAYNLDNMNSKKGTDEHFKIFIGFQNKVCTNLCVWSDGAMLDLKVKSADQLMAAIRSMIQNYQQDKHLQAMQDLCHYALTEHQFAQLIGRCRMYNHLTSKMKSEIPSLLFGDTQLGAVCKDYYRDNSFCKDEVGNINLWRLYNLFTGANKGSYIDAFLERSTNAFSFASDLKGALQHQTFNWYLS